MSLDDWERERGGGESDQILFVVNRHELGIIRKGVLSLCVQICKGEREKENECTRICLWDET